MGSDEFAPGVPRHAQDIEAFVREFEACTLPKPRWTHQAHLLVGLWYLSRHPPAEALNIVRERIRAYNVAVGTANTDRSGYHETITRLYLNDIAAHMARHGTLSLARFAGAFARLAAGSQRLAAAILFTQKAVLGTGTPSMG